MGAVAGEVSSHHRAKQLDWPERIKARGAEVGGDVWGLISNGEVGADRDSICEVAMDTKGPESAGRTEKRVCISRRGLAFLGVWTKERVYKD